MNLLPGWISRFRTSLKRFLQRLAPRPGHWLTGAQTAPNGRLSLAPWHSAQRHYRLYLPDQRRKMHSSALVVMLHGCKQDPAAIAAGSRFNELADQHHFAVLYPHQTRRANPYRCWNWFDPANQRGDGETATIAAMVETVVAEYHLDPDRVYIAGLSAGAAQAINMAVCYSHLFRAVAAHSGLAYAAASDPFSALQSMRDGSPYSSGQLAKKISLRQSDSRSLPALMIIHGSADEQVNPINAQQLANQWLKAQDADHDQAEKPLIANQVELPYKLDRYSQSNLDNIVVDGLGHAWSGGNDAYRYNDSRGPDASTLIWRFFAACDHRQPTNQTASEINN